MADDAPLEHIVTLNLNFVLYQVWVLIRAHHHWGCALKQVYAVVTRSMGRELGWLREEGGKVCEEVLEVGFWGRVGWTDVVEFGLAWGAALKA